MKLLLYELKGKLDLKKEIKTIQSVFLPLQYYIFSAIILKLKMISKESI